MSENRLFLSSENEKVIPNPRADPDYHRKSITSRRSPLARACRPSLVDVRFRVRQLSCLQNDRTNERMTEQHPPYWRRPSDRVTIDRQNINIFN